eukprot:scaffold32381_cov75-Phaeocystis_antarctica.AAC.1
MTPGRSCSVRSCHLVNSLPRACTCAACAAKRTELDFRIRICSEACEFLCLSLSACSTVALAVSPTQGDTRDDDLGLSGACRVTCHVSPRRCLEMLVK